jgi:polyisoprenoid-binding protein YceI
MTMHRQAMPFLGTAILLLTLFAFFVPSVQLSADVGYYPFSATSEIANEPIATNKSLNPAANVRYRLVSGQSRFTVRALVGGLLSSFGHDHTIAIRDFSGEAEITQDSVAPASLQMIIKADSLAVLDKVSNSDKQEIETKMRNEVLEVGQHPTITFKSTNISANKTAEGQYDVQIWGDVTLHGVTKSIWFKAVMNVNGNTLKAKGDFALRQSEFKIKPVTAAGGTIKVKDELKFSFDIAAVR